MKWNQKNNTCCFVDKDVVLLLWKLGMNYKVIFFKTMFLFDFQLRLINTDSILS